MLDGYVAQHRLAEIRRETDQQPLRAAGATADNLDAVRSQPSFATLFREYHKYLAGLAGGFLGL